MKRLFTFSLAMSALIFADTTVPQTASDLAITIYNDDRAFIHDVREANVTTGRQRLIYEGVPSNVITTSVVPTFSGVDTRLYSQNYIYDLISLESMLMNSIDKPVEFYTNGEEPTLSSGTLLAYSPVVMVRQKSTNKILTLEKPTQVIFPSVPEKMITRPSLVWNIETTQAGMLGVDLKYLTNGINWKSDYVLNLGSKSLDLVGWITVNNRSGVAYPNAQITCLAGEVNRVQDRAPRSMNKGVVMAAAPTPEVAEESFSGYHIYKIPFRETIANNQQKQIRFLDKTDVGFTQYGRLTNRYFEKGGRQKLRFANIVEFVNTQDNNMGIPLPSGIVRMYQADSTDTSHFIGESRVHNVPEGEKVKLTIGTLFDIAGEKTITKYTARKGYKNVETTYTLRNQGETAQTLKIEEYIPSYGENIRLKSGCSGICSERKISAFVREFSLKLKAKGEYKFTTEFEVYY
jgi:hypothetical protein